MSRNDATVIPPVRAGEIGSCIEFEYDHHQLGRGGFEAHSRHEWTFDSKAYTSLTDLGLGSDHPYVHQENGHTLRIVTEYRWSKSTFHDEPTYTLSMEQYAYRGTTKRDSVYWTRAGYWRLNEDREVGEPQTERQPYHARETYDRDIPHFGPIRGLTGYVATSGEQLVRQLHSGSVGLTVRQQLRDALEADSPDDAVTVGEYQNRPESTKVEAVSDD